MKILKRATPWMITLVILLGVYVASYVWYYKPKRDFRWWLLPTLTTKEKLLDQFYKPLVRWDEERIKQKTRRDLLRQCQGEWEGLVRPLSEGLTNYNQLIQVRVIIKGDQFKITQAKSMPELVGVTCKIGCEYDTSTPYGISSNADYPQHSSICLSYYPSLHGIEALGVANDDWAGKFFELSFIEQRLVRPAATLTKQN